MTVTGEPEAPTRVKVGQAKGRPMLGWVGKHPLRELPVFPAQEVERFALEGRAASGVDWSDWPAKFPQGGLLVHGDNKEVLAHLIANGFRGKVDLVYIDPPFDSGADYVRRVSLRGPKGSAQLHGEGYTLGEETGQYTNRPTGSIPRSLAVGRRGSRTERVGIEADHSDSGNSAFSGHC